MVYILPNQDPYAELKINQYTNRTKILKNKGDMPYWNQEFQFDLSNSKESHRLNVIIKDQDNLGDDIIGEAIIDVNPMDL